MSLRMLCSGLGRTRRGALAVTAGCLAAACVGSVSGEDGAGTSAPGSEPGARAGAPGGSGPRTPGVCGADSGQSPLRRLTRAEYDNVVRDLLGFDAKLAAAFPPDEKLGPFDANVTSPVSELNLEDYLKSAGELARRVVSDPKLLANVVPCDPKAVGDAACGRQLIEKLGLRAYRRPLASDEVDRVQRVFTAGLADGFATGVRLGLQMILLAPQFLYHMELGAAGQTGAVRALSEYEVASRLSFFLWGSMPDLLLFEAARTGELLKPAGLETQIRRMLADPRARDAVRSFHEQWLGVTKLLDRDQFDNPIGPSAYEELVRVIGDVLWTSGGKLPDLLTTTVAYVDAPLATLYGLAAKPATGFQKVDLDPKQRSGLLTRVAALAAHRTPTARGKFIRTEVLCQGVPPPPPDVDTALPPPDPNLSPRARWERHVTDPTCGSCHRLMDPVGFGLSYYDEVGKYRTMDGKWPVDARGEIVGTSMSDGPFNGGIELSARLAKAPELGACVAREMLVFALGRLVDPKRDGCTAEGVQRAFADAGYDVKALMTAIARSDGFRVRRVEP